MSAVMLGLLLMLAMPGAALADKRGRNHRDWNKHNSKCGKFVNCHDASDGRRDGKGPRRITNRWWNRNRNDSTWRNRIQHRTSMNNGNGRRFIVRRNR